ncbi:glycosyltransferase [Microbacterium lacus]|uniref:glycosyltransferase n=1 Tax=Microbacterium lacus TaxID=415217 RepID=UPI00384CA3B0
MSSILVCTSPAESHVNPILDVVRALVGRGHRVRVLTGARFADRIRALGAEPLALPAAADVLDDIELKGRPRGRRAMNEGLTDTFLRPGPPQLGAIEAALDAESVEAIVSDLAFVGTQLFAFRAGRPVLAAVGMFPLMVSSVDTGPFGLGVPPPRTRAHRLQYRMMQSIARRVILAPVHRDVDRFYRANGLPGLGDLFFTDYLFQDGLLDLYGQFTVPSFEYPRSDLPAHVRFFGALTPPVTQKRALPDWWEQLDDSRPIVHVSQGTAANYDLGELIGPTLDGLAGEPVTVVVSTGAADGRAVGKLPSLPDNAFSAEFLPYDLLMPRIKAFVTNGGYGGLHAAMRHGVPIVVAGDTEDKLETSARVAWSGVGINLKTGHPTPEKVRTAVRTVLSDPRYREASARIGADLAAAPGADGFVAAVEDIVAARRGSSVPPAPTISEARVDAVSPPPFGASAEYERGGRPFRR